MNKFTSRMINVQFTVLPAAGGGYPTQVDSILDSKTDEIRGVLQAVGGASDDLLGPVEATVTHTLHCPWTAEIEQGVRLLVVRRLVGSAWLEVDEVYEVTEAKDVSDNRVEMRCELVSMQ